MSDLEATKSPAHAAAPITGISSAKLRRISAGAAALSESGGLVDAFAEVFARIAAATSEAQPQQQVDNNGPQQVDSAEQKTQSDQTDNSQSDQNQSAPEAQVKADVQIEVEVEIDHEQISIEIDEDVASAEDRQQQIVDPLSETDGEAAVVVDATLDEEIDEGETERVVIAPVDTVQAETAEPEAEAAEVIVPEAEAEQDHDHRRDRKTSASVEPLENSDEGRRHSQYAKDDEPIQGAADTSDDSEQESLDDADQIDPGRSSRRLRGRPRYSSDANDAASRAASQADAARPQQPISDAAASEAANHSAVRSFEAQASAGSSKGDAAVVGVNNVASRIQQTNTANGAQAGTRGSTHAIESAEPSKASSSSPKPSAAEKQGGHAETVSRIKLIQRVSKAFQHLGPEGGMVRLRLAPPEMGSVRVEMRINQRKVQGRVVAETEAASAALREHLPDLRARLESFGMQVERLDIETESQDQQQGSAFDAEPRHQQQQGQRRRESRRWLESQSTERGAIERVSQLVSGSAGPYVSHDNISGVDIRL